MWFFEEPWKRLVSSLTEADQSWLLSEAAFDLRSLGRLTEAIEPIRAVLKMPVAQEDWKEAAAQASNLSQLELMLGRVYPAQGDAKQALEYADKSGDAFHRLTKRAGLADALHQGGERDQALGLFREAEAIQIEKQPECPLLYSMQGFVYSDALLAQGERAAWLDKAQDELAEACAAVLKRARQTLLWMRRMGWLLDIALDHLNLGRAGLYLSVLRPSGPSVRETAIQQLDEAVNWLHASGNQQHIPRGLLTRAWLRALEGNPAGARADLDEAWEIAERGPMRLFMADVHLYRARLFHDRDELAKARKLIEECGYGRRLGELEDAESEAKGWP